MGYQWWLLLVPCSSFWGSNFYRFSFVPSSKGIFCAFHILLFFFLWNLTSSIVIKREWALQGHLPIHSSHTEEEGTPIVLGLTCFNSFQKTSVKLGGRHPNQNSIMLCLSHSKHRDWKVKTFWHINLYPPSCNSCIVHKLQVIKIN